MTIISCAKEEAYRLGSDFIGTEHILLGLLRHSKSTATKCLTEMGINLDKVRKSIGETVRPEMDDSIAKRQFPFTPNAKKALELTLEEANKLSDQYIGTEHLLLAILRLDEEDISTQILANLMPEKKNLYKDALHLVNSLRKEKIKNGIVYRL